MTHEGEGPATWSTGFGRSPVAALAAGIALLALSLALLWRIPDGAGSEGAPAPEAEAAAFGPAPAPGRETRAEAEPLADRVDEFALAAEGDAGFDVAAGAGAGEAVDEGFGLDDEGEAGSDEAGEPGFGADEGEALWETGVLDEGIRRTTLSAPDGADPAAPDAFADVVVAEVEPLAASAPTEPLAASAPTEPLAASPPTEPLAASPPTKAQETREPPPVAAGPPSAVSGRGRLSVNAMPWATVSIDGEAFGETPLGEIDLPYGVHEVEATFPDGARVTREVTIGEEEVFLVLRPDA